MIGFVGIGWFSMFCVVRLGFLIIARFLLFDCVWLLGCFFFCFLVFGLFMFVCVVWFFLGYGWPLVLAGARGGYSVV